MSSKWLKCGERLRYMCNKCVIVDNKYKIMLTFAFLI